MITSKKIKDTLLLEPVENRQTYAENLKQLAHEYIDKGWWVLICDPTGKKPHYLVPNGYKGATNDNDQVDAWLDKVPNANLAIACGNSDLAVIDVDPKNGGGFREVDDGFILISKTGREYKVPKTRLVRTGSGGYHLYYSGALKLPRGRQQFFGQSSKGD